MNLIKYNEKLLVWMHRKNVTMKDIADNLEITRQRVSQKLKNNDFMSSTLGSSIVKKLLMSLSGLFLIMFLLVHLTVNSFLLIPDGGEFFNAGAHFMATNPAIRVIEASHFFCIGYPKQTY